MSRGVITELRDMVPIRPLTRSEAMRLAELQAQRLLALSGISQPPVPELIITELPRRRVRREHSFPVSGASAWSQQTWVIVLRSSEPTTRQRFSLAHEFKHILDHRFAEIIYGAIPDDQRQAAVEGICDYFAGCLLVPRPWLKRAWGNGLQTLPQLARHFGVSQAAMEVRLTQVGLIEPIERCDNSIDNWMTRRLIAKLDLGSPGQVEAFGAYRPLPHGDNRRTA